MSVSHEIITIQAGSFSNFIGTHWWNMQESSFSFDSRTVPEIDHEVLFREGENYKGEVTFTPRLVLIDLKDNVKGIRRECPLYRIPDDENPLWQGRLEVIKETPVTRNPFLESSEYGESDSDDNSDELQDSYDFNSETTVWSDYLNTNLHPRSFCLFQEMATDDKNPLEIYSQGEEVYKKSGKDMIEDSVRKLTEECDYLQGFQLIYDSTNGFSGITSRVMQHLNDEYSKHSILSFPTFQSIKPPPYEDLKEEKHRLYAILLSLSSMTSYCSLFSPLSLSSNVVKIIEPYRKFPYLNYDVNMPFQTSAILAASIDTLTSQFRLKTQKFTFSDLTSAMSSYSRKLICSSVSLPFPISQDLCVSDMLQKDVPEFYMTPLTPFYNPKSEKTAFQSAVLRGVPPSKFQNRTNKSYSVDPEEQFAEFLNIYSFSSVTTTTIFEDKCCVTHPFPNLFKKAVSLNGFVITEPYYNEMGVENIPVAASFSSSDSAGRYLDYILAEANKINFKEYVKRAEGTYEKDEFVEVLQNVIGLRDNYYY